MELPQHQLQAKLTNDILQDFDVGCVYKRQVQLTNVSYTVNYCKLVGVSDNLKDFLTIKYATTFMFYIHHDNILLINLFLWLWLRFTPPGSMSAGLACHMTAVFQPQVFQLASWHCVYSTLLSTVTHLDQPGYRRGGPDDVADWAILYTCQVHH